MKKKDIHLPKYLKDPLPEPEVSADDAWSEMNGMLGGNTIGQTGKFVIKSITGFVSLVGIALAVWLLYPSAGDEHHAKKVGNQKYVEGNKPNYEATNNTAADSAAKKSEHPSPAKKANHVVETLPVKPAVSGWEIDAKSAGPGLKTISSEKIERETENSKKRTKQNVNENWREGSKERLQPARSVGADKKLAAGNAAAAVAKADSKWQREAKMLVPKPFRYRVFTNMLTIQKPAAKAPDQANTTKPEKAAQPFFETLHFGLEWNASSSFSETKYIFAGTDSISRPYLLAIPGLWVDKEIGKNQSVMLSLYAYQPYFGGFKQVRQKRDSIPGSDSAFNYHNTKLVKAAGFNVSVQYNYHFGLLGMLSAGFGYSILGSGLFREDFQNYANKVYPGPLVPVRKDALGDYIKTNLFTFKTGLTFTPGRFQLGLNLVVPLNNLSVTQPPLRTVNGQVLIRYRIR